MSKPIDKRAAGGRSPSRRRPKRTYRERIMGGVDVLDRRHTALGVLVLIVAAIGGAIAALSVNGPPLQSRYHFTALISPEAPPVKKGDTVRFAGRLAGFVTDVKPKPHAREIEMSVEPSFGPIGEDARANVRIRSLTYLTFMEIIPGDTDHPLPDGGTIPRRRTDYGIGLIQVARLFDQKVQKTLAAGTANVGYGLAGRSAELNGAIAELRPSLHNGTAELEALTATPGALADITRSSAEIAAGLKGRRPDDVSAGIGASDKVLEAVARSAVPLGESIDLFPQVEAETIETSPLADPLLTDLKQATAQLTPAVRTLAASLPQTNRLLMLGGELRRGTSALSDVADPVLRRLGPILGGLYPTAASAVALLRPVTHIVNVFQPYRGDFAAAGRGIVGATDNHFPQGSSAPGNPALRFAPVLTCAKARQPFPDPGEVLTHSQSC